jgi:outer membrane protein OmpA-like peptidoglycan-associated protein
VIFTHSFLANGIFTSLTKNYIWVLANIKMKKIIQSLFIILFVSTVAFGQDSKHVICFDFDSDEINLKFDSELNQIVSIIKADDYYFVRIFGYSSATGDSIYYIDLSKRRAYSVYNRINQKVKIDDKRFYMTWIGESPDDYDLHYEHSHPQTKCVDVWIQIENKK